MKPGEAVRAVEGSVGSAAQVFPSRCRRCNANRYWDYRAIEGANELKMDIRSFAVAPFAKHPIYLFLIIGCVWWKLWSLWRLASQCAGFGLSEVAPAVEALGMKVG